jgi:methanogenic corrinoid protein MtbC1
VGDGDRRLPSWRQQFERACLRFDDTAADALIALASRHIGALGVLKQVILPVVASLGDAWHEGIVTVSQEHYASEVARRVAVSAPAAVAGGARSGGLTLTGCAPRERHELGLLALVAELRVHGHRVVHLGSDVPVDAFLAAVDAARPQVVVVAASMRGRLRPWAGQVREVRRRARTGVSFVWAGPGASNPGRMLPGVVADTAEAAIDAVLRALGP